MHENDIYILVDSDLDLCPLVGTAVGREAGRVG